MENCLTCCTSVSFSKSVEAPNKCSTGENQLSTGVTIINCESSTALI